ncbi:hypothetical protein H6F67_14520 [Microcoleus sp. FACHB-1515]|uniref:hypothetical protein n=1 Tax=Cyanophyceae TaxID=3028117 RepID=UPI00168A2F3A|nr:hypothetical protein [Microcoleus sp. FACHB-1515]MBD2091065.1 hypothetical protein [Microcoleus sp. FACHB-1515]
MRLFNRSLLFASVLSVWTVWDGGAVAQTPTASEQDLQRELLLRMVGTDSEVVLGRLPSDLPIDLPLPDQARIIGSIVSTESQENFSLYDYLIYLDVPRSPQQARDFYQEQLSRAGWREGEDFTSPGFVSTEIDGFPFGIPSTFCKDDQLILVSVRALSNNQAATVSLQLKNTANEPYSPCDRPEEVTMRDPAASIPLPELTAPPNTQVRAAGGGGSEDNWSSTANIESSLTDQALVAHYVSQLEQAGWTQQASDTADASVWSFLTLRDDEGQPWQAFLSIAPANEPNTYTASIIVLATNPTRSAFF